MLVSDLTLFVLAVTLCVLAVTLFVLAVTLFICPGYIYYSNPYDKNQRGRLITFVVTMCILNFYYLIDMYKIATLHFTFKFYCVLYSVPDKHSQMCH